MPVSKSELQRRAARIQLLVTDCDGVLTDNGVYFSGQGEEMKRFSIRDGMGVALLRNAGIETGIISGEASRSLQQRAEKLHIVHLYLGVTEKLQQVKALANHHNIPLDAIAYIGDDVNDADVMSELHKISLTAVPVDAMPSLHEYAQYICSAPGGHGAFREFSDWLLNLRRTAAPSVHSIQKKDRVILFSFRGEHMISNDIRLGHKYVGVHQPVYVIAEIGINHNGSLDLTKKLIDAAFLAGCDAVKFQKRTPVKCVPLDQWNIERDTPWAHDVYQLPQ